VSPKAAVIVLLVIVVVVVLVIFFGLVRPSTGPRDSGRGSVESALGWLRSRDTVTFDELARERPGCEDPATRTFAVVPGGTCTIGLPDQGAFTLCAGENVGLASAELDGPDFPPGTLEPDDLGCAEPAQVDVYDDDMVLSLRCAPFGDVCRFSVGEPGG
jgi:hypothetical protein